VSNQKARSVPGDPYWPS